jgi:penicillin-binding protein 1A
VRLPGIEALLPYFVNYVKQQLIERYGHAPRVRRGPSTCQTTIDLRLQKLGPPGDPERAQGAERDRPRRSSRCGRHGRSPRDVRRRQLPQSQFNLAVQGERQPGSSFKPFVLATALKQGVSPATTFESKPVNIFIGDKYWPVHNYENDYIGSGDLVAATAVSDNSIFAQLTKLVGPANVARTAHQLGITRHLNPYFAIGLGADAVSPLEMARAFSTFANQGRRVDGSAFGNRPRRWPGSTMQREAGRQQPPGRHAALTRDQDALLTSILEGVIRSGTGNARRCWVASQRQDRHDGELRRRVVRRLHTAARNRSVGGLSEHAQANAHRLPRPGR